MSTANPLSIRRSIVEETERFVGKDTVDTSQNQEVQLTCL